VPSMRQPIVQSIGISAQVFPENVRLVSCLAAVVLCLSRGGIINGGIVIACLYAPSKQIEIFGHASYRIGSYALSQRVDALKVFVLRFWANLCTNSDMPSQLFLGVGICAQVLGKPVHRFR
jgi:hypothetical protein